MLSSTTNGVPWVSGKKTLLAAHERLEGSVRKPWMQGFFR
jgi:hypothetical protein